MGAIFIDRTATGTSSPYFASRSKIKNRGVESGGPNPLRSHPKQFVEGIQSWSRMTARQHGELLP